MGGTPVDASLCEAHRKAFNVQLKGIASDVKEAKTGVNKLLRIITEGNGQEPLKSEVAKNTSFRKTHQARRLAGIPVSNMRWIAVIGWALTIGLAAWGFAT